MTTTYEIVQTATATVLFHGTATSEQDAREQMAREAGYSSHADMVATVGEDSGVTIREVR